MAEYSVKNPFRDFTKVQLIFCIILGVLVFISFLDILWEIVGPKPLHKEGFDDGFLPRAKRIPPFKIFDVDLTKVTKINSAVDFVNKKAVEPVNDFFNNIKYGFVGIGDGIAQEWNTTEELILCAISKIMTSGYCVFIYFFHSLILFLYYVIVFGLLFLLKCITGGSVDLFPERGHYHFPWRIRGLWKAPSVLEVSEYIIENLYSSLISGLCFKCTRKPILHAQNFNDCDSDTFLGSLQCFINKKGGKVLIKNEELKNARSFTEIAGGYQNGIDSIQDGGKLLAKAFGQ